MRREFSLPKRPYVLCPYYGLKNEGRIVAMVMITGLALMVYSIAERKLREALEKAGETLPDTAVSSRCLRVLQSFTEDQRWWRS